MHSLLPVRLKVNTEGSQGVDYDRRRSVFASAFKFFFKNAITHPTVKKSRLRDIKLIPIIHIPNSVALLLASGIFCCIWKEPLKKA